ncbi:MAG TPA: cell division protein FtsZ [Desulfovibrio sp.]|nr:cell division protein FtsZ [Desulfovibrio sp.]
MEYLELDQGSNARIKVVGCGGGGGNAVENMICSAMSGVTFITANTDIQALQKSQAEYRIQLGEKLTKGLGAGANPDVGRDAALESIDAIRAAIGDCDMVFVTAGMGGGTGTGATSIVAECAKELGILTIAVVTKPFTFEGKVRMRNAEIGIASLKPAVDTLITIPNDKLIDLVGRASLPDALRVADDVLRQGIQGISDLIAVPAMINLDFADVKTIMREKGLAHMGIGNASGEKRAAEAARQAIESPLLETSINGARGVLMNITGGPDLSLLEVNEAAELISENVDPEANIIFGADIDEAMGDALRITVIATGFDRPDRIGNIQGVPGFGAFSTFRSPYGSTGMGANQQQQQAQPQPQPQPYPMQGQPQPQPYPTQPQYQQPMRQPQPMQPQYTSASYAPRRPIMTDEPVAAPIPQQRQDQVFSENDIRRDYQEKPKSKLDVPAFLRNR